MPSESTRAYFYRIFLALSPVGVVYGFVSEGEASLWVVVASAVLGVSSGLATANTSTKSTNP